MARSAHDKRLMAQLGEMLRLTSANPFRWIAGAIVASLILALLDTIGVAAMIPLTALISGAEPDSGALGAIADVGGNDVLRDADSARRRRDRPHLRRARAWHRSSSAGGFSDARAGSRRSCRPNCMRRYMLAPYAAHRTRERNEVYRNIMEATGQASSVLMAVLSIVTDFMLLAAITVVLAITAPVVTLATVLLFAVFVLGLQRALRNLQSRIGEEIAESGLEAWGFLLPALDGFREARLTSSARVFVDGYQRSRLRGAHAGRQMSHRRRSAPLRPRDRLHRRDRRHLDRAVHHRHPRPGLDRARRLRSGRPARPADAQSRRGELRDRAHRSRSA